MSEAQNEKSKIFHDIVTKQYELFQLGQHLHFRGIGEVKKEIFMLVKDAASKGYTDQEFYKFCIDAGAKDSDLEDDFAYRFTMECFRQIPTSSPESSN